MGERDYLASLMCGKHRVPGHAELIDDETIRLKNINHSHLVCISAGMN